MQGALCTTPAGPICQSRGPGPSASPRIWSRHIHPLNLYPRARFKAGVSTAPEGPQWCSQEAPGPPRIWGCPENSEMYPLNSKQRKIPIKEHMFLLRSVSSVKGTKEWEAILCIDSNETQLKTRSKTSQKDNLERQAHPQKQRDERTDRGREKENRPFLWLKRNLFAPATKQCEFEKKFSLFPCEQFFSIWSTTSFGQLNFYLPIHRQWGARRIEPWFDQRF